MEKEELYEYILNVSHQKDKITQWVQNDYLNYPLVIYGQKGTFKSSIARFILKERTLLTVDIQFCKQKLSFQDYIEESLYKKSISMMFQKNSNVYKALIIDDITYILQHDKALFKSIMNFAKQKNNHPIIYIINSNDNKQIHSLYQQSCKLYLNYTLEQEKYIIYNFILGKDQHITEQQLNTLIYKSYHNFNSILTNLQFHQNDMKNLLEYDKTEYEITDYTKNILHSSIDDIYKKSYSDYTIISLNILDNFSKWLSKEKKLSQKEKHLIIEEIYYLNCIGDNYSTFIHSNNNWNLYENIITYSIMSPVLLLRLSHVKVGDVQYTSYISKSIIYTHTHKLLNNYNQNHNLLSCFYYCFYMYFTTTEKQKYKSILMKFIQEYSMDKKIIEKFYKIYNKFYLLESKHRLKLFFE